MQKYIILPSNMAPDKWMLPCLGVLLGIFTTVYGYDSAEGYFSQWRTENPEYAERMYPFSATYLDEPAEARSLPVYPNINFTIPYYGSKYDMAMVSEWGYIAFEPHDRTFIQYSRRHFPNGKYDGISLEEDPPMVMPYYSHISLNQRDRNYPLYYRVIDPREHAEGSIDREIAEAMLMVFHRDIRWASMKAQDFHPKYAIIVTWEAVRYNHRSALDPAIVNTFQAVIVTDEIRTFSIFNYHKLLWENDDGELDSQCSPTGTTTPDFPDCFPAQVGFNAGQGRAFHPLPFSNTPDVLKLADKVPGMGRFVYEISGDEPIRGGCLDGEYAKSKNVRNVWPLETSHDQVSMFGDEELHLSGPCLTMTDTVKCKFGDDDTEIEGFVVDENRAGCITPFKPQIDDTDVYLYVNGESTPYQTTVNIVHPERRRPEIDLENYKHWVMTRDPESLTLRWRPESLYMVIYNETENNGTDPNENLMVDILLYGYKELEDANQVQWMKLHTFETGYENSGVYTFSPADHRCETDSEENCDWHIGAIKIQVTQYDTNRQRGIWSKPTPLAWFHTEYMEKEHGSDWPYEQCKENPWKDEGSKDWIDHLEPCPCRFDQAYTDSNRFIVDPECDPSMPDQPCPLHEHAKFCVISSKPSASGAGTKCCYNQNDLYLVYSGDTQTINGTDVIGDSFSELYHVDGVYPYKEPKKIPSLAHWLWDKLPYLWCCKWADNQDQCISHFLKRRPTPDCKDHHAPGNAFSYGDPHFRTFDGVQYTFNGLGEYWFIKTDAISDPPVPELFVQARMQRPHFPSVDHPLNATIINTVVMQEGPSTDATIPHVEFRLTPYWNMQRIAVFVNAKPVNFHKIQKRVFGQDKNRITIYRNSDEHELLPSNFTVHFQSGATINVAVHNDLMHVAASLSPVYKKHTHGLFGFWDDDSKNDLKNRAGEIIDPTIHDSEHIHNYFGLDWMVEEDEALFNYVAWKNWTHFKKESEGYTPNFEAKFPDMENIVVTPEDVNEACGTNQVCTFDYMTTLQRAVAVASMQTQEWNEAMVDMSAYAETCGQLDIPRGHKTFNHYMKGGYVIFTGCDEGYTLRGDKDYVCETVGSETKWVPDPTAHCKSNAEISKEQSELAAAIAVPITLLVLIAIIVGAILFMKRKKKDKPDGKYEDPPRQQAPTNPGSLSMYPDPKAGKTGSRSSSLSGSKTSLGSVVLSEELHAARPPRPPPSEKPKLQRPGSEQQQPTGPSVYPDLPNDQYAPTSSYGPPPYQTYDNRGADIDPKERQPSYRYQPSSQAYDNPVVTPETNQRHSYDPSGDTVV